MDSRQLKKRILFEMASEYEAEYNKRKADFEGYGYAYFPEYFYILERVYDLETSEITKAKIKRFEKILQEIVDNFESKI